jgi:nucleotidyltransferase/DNA polymerase involved in DNA repair
VEPLSLDEAYLDVTKQKIKCQFIVEEIRERIFLMRWLNSLGISINKLLLKS